MFPLMLDLTGRSILVVGGGPVGRGKAIRLSQGGGTVRLICLEPRPDDWAFPIEWQQQSFQAPDLDEVFLVVAAASTEVNRQVLAEARQRGVLVNMASEPERGDVHFPAVLSRDSFTLAVSTEGASPALARQIRDHLDTLFDDRFAEWIGLLGEMRENAQGMNLDEVTRREAMQNLASEAWLERLRSRGVEATRKAMSDYLTSLANPMS